MSSAIINRNKGRHVPHNNVEVGETYVVEQEYFDPSNSYRPGDHLQTVMRIFRNNQGTITAFKTNKFNSLPVSTTKFYKKLPKALRSNNTSRITYPKGMSPKAAYVKQQGLKRSNTVRNRLNQLRKKNNATRRRRMMNLAQQLQEMQLGNNNHGNNQNNNNRNNNI